MNRQRVAIALIRAGGRFFLQRRDPGAVRCPGLWEFPGGKVEAGETARAALLRELREELSWAPDRLEPLPPLQYSYPDLEVLLEPFLCQGGGPPGTDLAWGWFTAAEWSRLAMPEANRRLEWLLDKMESQ